MERLLDLAKKNTEDAEVYLTSYERTRVIFEANQLKQLTTDQGTEAALRLAKKGRIGIATSTSLQDRKGLVRRAVDVAEFGAEARFHLPSRLAYPSVSVHDSEMERVSLESMVALGKELIERVREHTPELVCDARITRRTSLVRLINSRGGEGSYEKSNFVVELEGVLVRGTDMLFVGDQESSCQLIKETDGLLKEVIRQLEWTKREASVTGTKLPVILTPNGVASALFPALRQGFNGSTVLQGASPLQHCQGEMVFDKRLSFHDDPSLPFRPRSRPCDDEGVPTQRTTLVDKGVVQGFLYDLQTAGLANQQSTGNCKRESGVPLARESALVIDAGDIAFEDMLKIMKEGLVVDLLMGASQANVLGGDFGGNVLLGYKVEQGEVVGRAKNVVLSGNVYNSLSEVAAIGRECRWVGGMAFVPALYLSGLAVASKAG